MFYTDVNDYIKSEKEKRGLTNADIGEAIGTTASTVGRWLWGTKINPRYWERLEKYFDIKIEGEFIRDRKPNVKKRIQSKRTNKKPVLKTYRQIIANDDLGLNTKIIFKMVSAILTYIADNVFLTEFPSGEIKDGDRVLEKFNPRIIENPHTADYQRLIFEKSFSPRTLAFDIKATAFIGYLMNHKSEVSTVFLEEEIVNIYNEWVKEYFKGEINE